MISAWSGPAYRSVRGAGDVASHCRTAPQAPLHAPLRCGGAPLCTRATAALGLGSVLGAARDAVLQGGPRGCRRPGRSPGCSNHFHCHSDEHNGGPWHFHFPPLFLPIPPSCSGVLSEVAGSLPEWVACSPPPTHTPRPAPPVGLQPASPSVVITERRQGPKLTPLTHLSPGFSPCFQSAIMFSKITSVARRAAPVLSRSAHTAARQVSESPPRARARAHARARARLPPPGPLMTHDHMTNFPSLRP